MNSRIDQPLHIILSVKDVLEITVTKSEMNELPAKWFLDNNMIIQTEKNHLLYPGTIEFIQYLFNELKAKVSFFYSNAQHHGYMQSFIQALLIRSLGDERYNYMKAEIGMYTYQDLVPSNKNYIDLQYKQFGISSGNFKKDLLKLTGSQEALNQTILIDYDASYIQYKQESHFIKTDIANFHDILDISNGNNIFFKINHIFYALGLIKKALSQPHLPFNDYLFDVHFKKTSETDLPRFNKKLKNQQAYLELGLVELKKINPSLTFLTQENINPYKQAEIERKYQLELIEKENRKKLQIEADKKYSDLRKYYLRPFKKNKQNFLINGNRLPIPNTDFLQDILDNYEKCQIYIGDFSNQSYYLSMLYYFLSDMVDRSINNLFQNYEVSMPSCFNQYCGKYSVIYLDFNDVQANNADELYVLLREKMIKAYKKHNYILENEKLNETDIKYILKMLDQKKYIKLDDSLTNLISYIHGYNKQQNTKNTDLVLIIDGYDNLTSEHCKKIGLVDYFYSGLKDNRHLYRIIMGGKKKLDVFSRAHYFDAASYFSQFVDQPLALNGTQKAILDATLNTYWDDILNLDPATAIYALNSIFNNYYLFSVKKIIFKDTLESLKFIRKIYFHDYPQNRRESYASVGHAQGFRAYKLEKSHIYGEDRLGNIKLKNGRIIKAKNIIRNDARDNYILAQEKAGLLGLTAREDDCTPYVTKEAVSYYIQGMAQYHIVEKAKLLSHTPGLFFQQPQQTSWKLIIDQWEGFHADSNIHRFRVYSNRNKKCISAIKLYAYQDGTYSIDILTVSSDTQKRLLNLIQDLLDDDFSYLHRPNGSGYEVLRGNAEEINEVLPSLLTLIEDIENLPMHNTKNEMIALFQPTVNSLKM